ncbi:hypothetical protein SAY87_013451 [Trapa incisa]|uniref:Uncharacterized protein n=1 Tax=Trapa incisa TaxID=236973 RepID=A0AAN7QDB2_9MYRT|nr:hypothetical protein SAY87_013451 [Trapa incisa]
MACPSPKNPIKLHVRSISLPSKLHPTYAKIDEKLNEFRSWSATCTSSSVSVLEGLPRAKELYFCCFEEVLCRRNAQQILGKHRQEKSVEGLLEGSVKILDVCAISRELLWKIKERVRDLQSTIRRRKTGQSLEVEAARFAELRKTVKKQVKGLIASLKQMRNEIIGVSPSVSSNEDDQLSEIIRMLIQVQLSSILVFHLLFSFLAQPRQARGSVMSRMIHRQGGDLNDMEGIDASLRSLYKVKRFGDFEILHQKVRKQLGELDFNVGRIEDGLESIFRQLIRTRASLLNIISQ